VTGTSTIDSGVGFIGLGRMGTPMAARLLGAGYTVTGYDPSPKAGAALADPGFQRARRAADVTVGRAVIVLMLPSSDVVEAVIEELEQSAAVAPGSVLIDMSSSDPMRTRALARRLFERRAILIDAPVSGGVTGAKAGRLTIMVGGPVDVFEKVRPALDAMGTTVMHLGGVGAGHAVKAINNLMSATHLLASSEALLAARGFGLDLSLVLEAVNRSSGRSGSTETKWPRFILSGSHDSGFAMELMVKDMRIAQALGEDLGVAMPLSQCALQLWESAESDLPSGADHTEIASWLEALGSVAE
jgi:3-hydroxyisobutyrate dehydrogenase